MKRLLIIILLFFGLMSIADAQYLNSTISQTQDTIILAGSTDAGTRWFTNKAYNQVWFEIKQGSYWYTYRIAYPGMLITSIRAYLEGSDSTLYIQSSQNGEYINLPIYAYPLVATTIGNILAMSINYDGASNTLTSPAIIRFRGVKAPFLNY